MLPPLSTSPPTPTPRSRTAARAVLAFWLLIALATVLVASLSRDGRLRALGPKGSDVDLYRAVVDRVHAGQGYYPALRAELLDRGYPTSNTFNWRMPVPLALLGHLPDPAWGKFLLVLWPCCWS